MCWLLPQVLGLRRKRVLVKTIGDLVRPDAGGHVHAAYVPRGRSSTAFKPIHRASTQRTTLPSA